MPTPLRRGLIDADDLYGDLLKNDKHAHRRSNLRTKATMTRAHKCGDKECGHVPYTRECITKLHIAWCPAPKVDDNPKSATYNQVVMCGQQFAVISPSGCADHPYKNGFNLDIKDARNDVTGYEIQYKKVFAEFKIHHDAKMATKAKNQSMLQRRVAMSEHQMKSMANRQEQMEFRKARELAAADARGGQTDRPDLGDGGREDQLSLDDGGQENQLGFGDGGQEIQDSLGDDVQNPQPLRGQGAHLARQPLALRVANGHRIVEHPRGSRTGPRRLPAQAAIQPPMLGLLAEHDAEVKEARPEVGLPTVPSGRGTYKVSTAQQYTGLKSLNLDGVRQALPILQLEEDADQTPETSATETSKVESPPIDPDVPPLDAEDQKAVVEQRVPPLVAQSADTYTGTAFESVTVKPKITKEMKHQQAAERRRNRMTAAAEQARVAADEKRTKAQDVEVAKMRKETKRKGGQSIPGFGAHAVRAMRRKEKSDQAGS